MVSNLWGPCSHYFQSKSKTTFTFNCIFQVWISSTILIWPPPTTCWSKNSHCRVLGGLQYYIIHTILISKGASIDFKSKTLKKKISNELEWGNVSVEPTFINAGITSVTVFFVYIYIYMFIGFSIFQQINLSSSVLDTRRFWKSLLLLSAAANWWLLCNEKLNL